MLVALATFSIYQVACYETGKCSGDRQFYTNYALLAIISIYALAAIHVLITKIQKK